MNHNHIPRILALLLVIAMIVLCILLATPVRAAECRLVGKPEPTPWEPDEAEVELLACAIYCEAGGNACSDLCRYYVGDVVLNRMADPRFPGSMEEVLTAPGQYGTFSQTGIVWPSRASKPEEAAAVQRAYDTARDLLSGHHSDLYDQGYIWQAEFSQGKDVIYETGLYFGR